MNLLKLQDQLKGLPDNNLMTMAQQPTGQAPQFLVLAEIQRRKDMRESAQPAPNSTVADDLEQQGLAALQPPPAEEAGPEQMDAGLAALPTNMPEAPQSMAGGGIIAFAQGKLVNGNIKPLTAAQFARLTPADQQAYVAKFGTPPSPRAEKSSDLIKSIFGGEVNPADPSYAQRLQGLLGAAPGENVFQNLGTAIATEAQSPAYGVLAAAKNKPLAPAVMPSAITPPAMTPPVVPDRAGNILANSALNARTPVQAPADLFTYTDLPSADAQFDKLIRPERTAQDYKDELSSMIGENTGITALKDKLAGMEERDKTTAEDAPWMALMRAGLGMAAGTSPFALSNIASGGIEGLKDYAATKERLTAAEEKRFEIESRIAESERNEQVMEAKHGIDSAQADKAVAETQRLKRIEANLNIDVANKTGRFEAQKANVDTNLKKQQLSLQERELNKPSSEIQLLNYLKNPKNAAVYEATIGAKKSGALTEEDWLVAFTKAGGQVGTGMTLEQFKNSVSGSGTTDYNSKYGLTPRSTK